MSSKLLVGVTSKDFQWSKECWPLAVFVFCFTGVCCFSIKFWGLIKISYGFLLSVSVGVDIILSARCLFDDKLLLNVLNQLKCNALPFFSILFLCYSNTITVPVLCQELPNLFSIDDNLFLMVTWTGTPCFRGYGRRNGERRRKSVRGCIVSPDLSVLNLVIVKKGENDLPGLTDVEKPRMRGPKRASKIRKLFNLSKEDDVRKYVNTYRRTFTTKAGKLSGSCNFSVSFVSLSAWLYQSLKCMKRTSIMRKQV